MQNMMCNVLTYNEYAVQLQEIPDEISLSFYICQCPHRCHGCSSPWLQEVGKYKLISELDNIINKYSYITCVCFMGGDLCHNDIIDAAKIVHAHGIKTAMYSGDDEIDKDLVPYLDYYKVGHWDEKRGPLNEVEKTNQRMYKIVNLDAATSGQIIGFKRLIDITYKFKHTM